MAHFEVTDDALTSLHGSVVVVTGGSSGIGLAAVQGLLARGAKVVAGDLQAAPDVHSPDFTYVPLNVNDWKALVAFFKTAIDRHGRIDHVFANAGIGGKMDLLGDEVDEDGVLKQPDHLCIDTNLKACIDTVKLGIHHVKKNPTGGSIVMTASASAFQCFSMTDYCSAKHGVLGLLRGLHGRIGPGTEIPIRVNAIAPSWTLTGLVPKEVAQRAGIRFQSADDAARSALILMADSSRHCQLIYSCQGKYTEVEETLLSAANAMLDRAASVDPRMESEQAEFLKIHSKGQEENQAATPFWERGSKESA